MGLGHNEDVWEPTLVKGIVAKNVSCGGCHTLVLSDTGGVFAAGAEAGLGAQLSGNRFQRWEDDRPAVLVHSGSKNSFFVLEERPTELYVVGSNELGCLGLPDFERVCNPTLVNPEISGSSIEQVLCTRFCAIRDDLGHVYFACQGEWKRAELGDSSALQIALGVLNLSWLEKETNRILYLPISAVTGAVISEAQPVVGSPEAAAVYAGHRTTFCVTSAEIIVTNRDALGKLRSKCLHCQKCPRFAGATNLKANESKVVLKCLRCACDALAHKEAPEVEIVDSIALNHSPKLLALEQDQSMPLAQCRDLIRKNHSLIKQINVENSEAMRVWAVSDIHTDFKGNMLWLQDFVAWAGDSLRNDVIIVAGDISHIAEIIENTLCLFLRACDNVFHVAGNHELWVAPKTETVKHGYHKLIETEAICAKLGVHFSPVIFKDSNSRRPLVIAPLLTWYEPQFAGLTQRQSMEGFDIQCRWPVDDQTLTTEFLTYNPILALQKAATLGDCRVVTFSHFIPRTELFYGWPNLREVMGSTRIDEQIRQLSSQVHIFGHSHLDIDRTTGGVRYIQHALGSEARHRTQSSFPSYKPKLVSK